MNRSLIRSNRIFAFAINLAAAAIAAAGSDSQPIHLAANVGDLKASGTSLSQVLNQIQTTTGNAIQVDWVALKDAHITQQLPVTVDISNLPADKALTQLLDAVGGSHVKLGYSTDNGSITITTAAELSKNTVTHVYDIQAALKSASAREPAVAAVIRRIRGIDPLSWHDAGGAGTVDELGGYLIVVQTPDLQARIAAEITDITPAVH